MCTPGRKRKLSNITNAISGETRKKNDELPKIMPKPKILKENETILTKEE